MRDDEPRPVWMYLCNFVEYISQNRSHPHVPKSEFKEVTAAHVGRHCSGFPGSFLSGTLLSCGASTVARTSGRGHVESAHHALDVCVYYCRTYDKAVCGGGGGP